MQDLRICHVMLGKFLSCSEPPSRQISLLFITNLPDTFLPSIRIPLDSLPPRFPFLSPSSSVKRFSDHTSSQVGSLFPPTIWPSSWDFLHFSLFSTRLENKVLFSASLYSAHSKASNSYKVRERNLIFLRRHTKEFLETSNHRLVAPENYHDLNILFFRIGTLC